MALLFSQCSLPHLAFSNTGNHVLLHGHGGHMRVGSRHSKKGNNLTRCAISYTSSEDDGVPDTKILFKNKPITRKEFGDNFMFGASTSAFQSEGPPSIGGRGPAGWDSIIGDKQAALSYLKYKDDVQNLKEMGMNAYRFSISWSRILPKGKGKINEEGIKFYNNLIDELLKNKITPIVTLVHFDVPQSLMDAYGGFLSDDIVEDFKNYCDICFQRFGDRVKHWTTINEPDVFTQYGYFQGLKDVQVVPTTFPYIVAHNIVLAHAHVYRHYEHTYKANQEGQIGMSISLAWFNPYDETSTFDQEAAIRGTSFHVGLFMDPLVFGEYRDPLKSCVRERLPEFSKEEVKIIKGAYDFVGINYYITQHARHLSWDNSDKPVDFETDQRLHVTVDNKNGIGPGRYLGDKNYMAPDGLKDGLIYMKNTYKNPLIYITENGVVDLPSPSITADNHRINFIIQHLKAVYEAKESGVNVRGYMHWSLMDVVEMGGGYDVRLGLYHTDYKTFERIPKNSAKWFTKFLEPTPTPATVTPSNVTV